MATEKKETVYFEYEHIPKPVFDKPLEEMTPEELAQKQKQERLYNYYQDLRHAIDDYQDKNGYERSSTKMDATKFIVVANLGINRAGVSALNHKMGEDFQNVDVIYFPEIAKAHGFEKLSEQVRESVATIAENSKQFWFVNKILNVINKDKDDLSPATLKDKVGKYASAYGYADTIPFLNDIIDNKPSKADLEKAKKVLLEKVKAQTKLKVAIQEFVRNGEAVIKGRATELKIQQDIQNKALKETYKLIDQTQKIAQEAVFTPEEKVEISKKSEQMLKFFENLDSEGVRKMVAEEMLYNTTSSQKYIDGYAKGEITFKELEEKAGNNKSPYSR